MRRVFLGKKAYLVLACSMMFQSAPLSADITSSVSIMVNQLRDSLAINNLFENRIAAGCLAIIAMILAYKSYFKYTNNKLVSEIEKLLELEHIRIRGSYGALGPELYLRTEAIYKVLDATQNPDRQQERVRQLLQNPIVKMGLIRKQEELLKKELESARDIWQLDSYGDIARKKLGLGALTQRCSFIGSDSDNRQKKEAYDKLDSKSRQEVAFETFSRNLYRDHSSLQYWQENSSLFKEPLKQILAVQKK